MLTLVFVILVVLGFAFHFLATFNYQPPSLPFTRLAWGCWLVASVIWALGGAK